MTLMYAGYMRRYDFEYSYHIFPFIAMQISLRIDEYCTHCTDTSEALPSVISPRTHEHVKYPVMQNEFYSIVK